MKGCVLLGLVYLWTSAECHRFRTHHTMFIKSNEAAVLALQLQANESTAHEVITVNLQNVGIPDSRTGCIKRTPSTW